MRWHQRNAVIKIKSQRPFERMLSYEQKRARINEKERHSPIFIILIARTHSLNKLIHTKCFFSPACKYAQPASTSLTHFDYFFFFFSFIYFWYISLQKKTVKSYIREYIKYNYIRRKRAIKFRFSMGRIARRIIISMEFFCATKIRLLQIRASPLDIAAQHTHTIHALILMNFVEF